MPIHDETFVTPMRDPQRQDTDVHHCHHRTHRHASFVITALAPTPRSSDRRWDLQDWNAKRPPLGRTAYRARLRAVLRSKKAQSVAGRYAAGLLNVCKEVLQKKGAASRG